MVTADMVDRIKPFATTYVEVSTSVGIPQALYNRFDGTRTTLDPFDDRPDLGGVVWKSNSYYPSPEMHLAAGATVAQALRRVLT